MHSDSLGIAEQNNEIGTSPCSGGRPPESDLRAIPSPITDRRIRLIASRRGRQTPRPAALSAKHPRSPSPPLPLPPDASLAYGPCSRSCLRASIPDKCLTREETLETALRPRRVPLRAQRRVRRACREPRRARSALGRKNRPHWSAQMCRRRTMRRKDPRVDREAKSAPRGASARGGAWGAGRGRPRAMHPGRLHAGKWGGGVEGASAPRPSSPFPAPSPWASRRSRAAAGAPAGRVREGSGLCQSLPAGADSCSNSQKVSHRASLSVLCRASRTRGRDRNGRLASSRRDRRGAARARPRRRARGVDGRARGAPRRRPSLARGPPGTPEERCVSTRGESAPRLFRNRIRADLCSAREPQPRAGEAGEEREERERREREGNGRGGESGTGEGAGEGAIGRTRGDSVGVDLEFGFRFPERCISGRAFRAPLGTVARDRAAYPRGLSYATLACHFACG